MPRAYSEITISVKLPTEVCRLPTIFGSNSPLRSRGVSRATSPKSPRTVLAVAPFREAPLPRPSGAYFADPRCSSISTSSRASKVCFTRFWTRALVSSAWLPPPARTWAMSSFFSASGCCTRLALSGTSIRSSMERFPFFFRLIFAPPRLALPGRTRRPLLGRTSVALRAPCVLPKSNSRRASPFKLPNNLHRKCYSAAWND